MKLDGCNALITGASAGIGREFARRLAFSANSLVLVARRKERLEQLLAELHSRNSQLAVHLRVVDLSETVQIDQMIEWLDQNKISIDLLINNAGLGDIGDFATSAPERDDQMLLVNIVALTRLTKKLLPQMIERKRGAVLNVGSCAGFLPIPEFAVYAATKAYVTSFSEALRAELRGSGVRRHDTLPRSGPHRIRGRGQTTGRAAGGWTRFHLRPCRTGRARCAGGDRSGQTHRDPWLIHEARNVSSCA